MRRSSARGVGSAIRSRRSVVAGIPTRGIAPAHLGRHAQRDAVEEAASSPARILLEPTHSDEEGPLRGIVDVRGRGHQAGGAFARRTRRRFASNIAAKGARARTAPLIQWDGPGRCAEAHAGETCQHPSTRRLEGASHAEEHAAEEGERPSCCSSMSRGAASAGVRARVKKSLGRPAGSPSRWRMPPSAPTKTELPPAVWTFARPTAPASIRNGSPEGDAPKVRHGQCGQGDVECRGLNRSRAERTQLSCAPQRRASTVLSSLHVSADLTEAALGGTRGSFFPQVRDLDEDLAPELPS